MLSQRRSRRGEQPCSECQQLYHQRVAVHCQTGLVRTDTRGCQPYWRRSHLHPDHHVHLLANVRQTGGLL